MRCKGAIIYEQGSERRTYCRSHDAGPSGLCAGCLVISRIEWKRRAAMMHAHAAEVLRILHGGRDGKP